MSAGARRTIEPGGHPFRCSRTAVRREPPHTLIGGSVDELITNKLDEKWIRNLVLQSLEGPPKDTARLAYKNGKGSLKDILRALDKLYG